MLPMKINIFGLMRFPIVLLSVFAVITPCFAAHDDMDSVPGFTEAVREVEIGLSDPGRIAEILVKEGDVVEQGQRLISLDTTIQEIEVKRQKLRITSEAELAYVKKRKRILEQQLLSSKSLLEDGAVISKDEFEEKELQYSQATSELARIKLRRQIEQLELSLAKERLSRRLLNAPFAGTVVFLSKDVGERVVPQESIVRLIDISKGRFAGNAEESVGYQFVVGQQSCMLVSTPFGKEYIPATVTFISSTVDTASGLMEVKAEFLNQENSIRLGSPAELLLWDENTPCKAIPEEIVTIPRSTSKIKK